MTIYDNISIDDDNHFENIDLNCTHTLSITNCSIDKIKNLRAHSIFLTNIKNLTSLENVVCANLIVLNCPQLTKVKSLNIPNHIKITDCREIKTIDSLNSNNIELEELHQLKSIKELRAPLINIIGNINLKTIDFIHSKSLEISDFLPNIKKMKTFKLFLSYLDGSLNNDWTIESDIFNRETNLYSCGNHKLTGTYILKEKSQILDL